MSIFRKILEIYNEYFICVHCLGRMFALLGSSTTNQERGYSLLLSLTMKSHRNFIYKNGARDISVRNLRLLAENARFLPAQSVLNNEGIVYDHNETSFCYLCNNIFSNLQPYVYEAVRKLKDYEFNNFLVGTDLNSEIINREDIFKSKFNLLEAESFKSHFNREIGKNLTNLLNKPTEFANPDITIIFSLRFNSFNVELQIKSLFIYGKYNKYLRDIPQTHWNCRACRGRGCELCNYSGKQYQISVEELTSPEFVKKAKATNSKFHGAGREDIDAKMLGDGRPFILELKNPKKRILKLEKIEKRVNKRNKKKVKVSNLRYSSKNEVKEVKRNSEKSKKLYRVLVESEKEFSKEEFKNLLQKLKVELENQIIDQKTPSRVSHRRADKVRKKKVYNIVGKYLKSHTFEFLIETQGGTYIKELISGDEGRTQPSFALIFRSTLFCKELDVLKIF